MKRIKDYNGNTIDFEAAVMMMDDEIREELHAQGIEDEQEFYNAYCDKHTRSTAKILRFENGEERRCPQGSVLNVARRLNAAMKINFCVKRAQQNQRLILLLSLKIVHAARAEPHLKGPPCMVLSDV